MDLLLASGDRLDIVLEGGWRRPATVTAVDAARIDLSFDGDAGVLPAGLNWCSAEVEWTADTGTATKSHGILHAIDGGLRLELTGGTGLVQRRRHRRIPADLVVDIDDEQRRLKARTLDVSVGGMLLGGVQDLPAGREIGFTFDLGDVVVIGHGIVVRETPDATLGVRFTELDDDAVASVSRLTGAAPVHLSA